jgi:hypothetical protein
MSRDDKKTTIGIMLTGDKGSGKTALLDLILPALEHLGATVVHREERKNKGTELVTLNVPAGAFASVAEKIDHPPRVGFDNFEEVAALVREMAALRDYADEDLAVAVAQQALPPALRKTFEPVRVVELIRDDARTRIREITRQLAALGFDTNEAEPE